MADFVLSCSSSADLSDVYMKQRDIVYVSHTISLNDVDYKDDMWQSMRPEEMYERMLAGEVSKTSQISVGEYIDHFTKILEDGKDLIHFSRSSGISGTVNSAMNAKMELEDKYPDRKIYVVDSLAASSGFGLFVDKMADLRDEGKSIDEIYAYAEMHKLNLVHWFFSSDLTFYIRGGRVSKTAGFVGNLLNICPLLNVDNMGRLIPREKIRTKKKVIKRIVEKMEELAEDGHDYSGKVFISHSACRVDAEEVEKLVREKFPRVKSVTIFPIGGTIGAHTGPGTVALFFWGKKRKD